MRRASDLPPGFHPGAFSDFEVVGVAVAAGAGAYLAAPVPLPIVVVVVSVLAIGRCRRPAVVAIVMLLACSFLADRSLAGLAAPVERGVAGRATLVTDPERFGAAVRVDVRLDGRRYEIWLRGGHAGVVDELAVGDSFALTGRVRAPRADDASWFRPRHVAGRIDVDSVAGPEAAGPPWSWSNAVRGVLGRGLEVLDDDRRALAIGFLVGDDRGLDPVLADDLQAAGLTHLSAVSGQNVAFVLALVRPLLWPAGRWGRLAGIAAVLVLFGFVTRWEPSVLRATAMAGVAIGGAFGGRQASGVRYLALAVVGLLVIDPLLVWSVGFRLSVAASLGILTISPRLADRLAGPPMLREALAVTIGAQLAVAPLLLATFGPVPLASVPANVLAGPAAGLAMMWGLPAGLLAGMTGRGAAAVLHWPTGLFVGWVAAVARWASDLPLPRVGPLGLVAATAAVTTVLAGGRRRRVRVVALAVVAIAVVVGIGRRPPDGHWAALDVDLWRGGGAVVVVVDRPSPPTVLELLRSNDIGRIDLLVLRSPSYQAADVAEIVALRHDIVDRLDPSAIDPGGRNVLVGELTVRMARDGDRLDVAVEPRG